MKPCHEVILETANFVFALVVASVIAAAPIIVIVLLVSMLMG
jgi:hypothetical protein